MKYKYLIFDFDGVLCSDFLYNNLSLTHPEVFEFINSDIFRRGSVILDSWMRGECSYLDVNRYICDHTSICLEMLNNLFEEGVKTMRLNRDLLKLLPSFQDAGYKLGLVTNNMDIFSKITVPYNKLSNLFPTIVNSADHQMLKQDANGRLFLIALEQMGAKDTKQALLVDDSRSAISAFSSLGGATYHYSGYEAFLSWCKINLL